MCNLLCSTAVCNLKELSQKVVLSYSEYISTNANDGGTVYVLCGNLAPKERAEIVVLLHLFAKECLVYNRAESRLYYSLELLVFADAYLLVEFLAAVGAKIAGCSVYCTSFKLVCTAGRTL